MTQKQTIYSLLKSGDWTCGTVFMQSFIPEYRSRINELRKEGQRIITRKCLKHKHNGQLQEWRLVYNEATIKNNRLSKTDFCDVCGWFMGHNPECIKVAKKVATLGF